LVFLTRLIYKQLVLIMLLFCSFTSSAEAVVYFQFDAESGSVANAAPTGLTKE
jgi:hypothetical protein